MIRENLAMQIAAAQFTLSILPDCVTTIKSITTHTKSPLITVSTTRKPTKKEKRICATLNHWTPMIGAMRWDEWIGHVPSLYGITVELRWRRIIPNQGVQIQLDQTMSIRVREQRMHQGDIDDISKLLGVM